MSTLALERPARWPLVVLGTLAFMAAVLTVWRFTHGLASISNINDAYPWGWWTGFFMTLIAFGGCGFTIGLVVEVFGRHQYEPFVRPAIVMGLLFYLSYAVILTIELGRPWKGFLVFFSWAPHSPLFEIALCATAYMTCLFIEVGTTVAQRFEWRRVFRVLSAIYIPVAILGITLSHIHQSTLGTAMNIIPLKVDARWWSDLMPITFLLTAYAAGFALIIVEHVLATHWLRLRPRVELLGGLAQILAVVLGVYLTFRIGDLLRRGVVPSMFDFSRLSIALWLELVVGAILPFVMLLLPEVRRSKWALLAAASLVAGGVLLNRMNNTVVAMKVKSWQSYTPAWGEVLTSIGTVAGFALVFALAVRYLPIHEEPALDAGEAH